MAELRANKTRLGKNKKRNASFIRAIEAEIEVRTRAKETGVGPRYKYYVHRGTGKRQRYEMVLISSTKRSANSGALVYGNRYRGVRVVEAPNGRWVVYVWGKK